MVVYYYMCINCGHPLCEAPDDKVGRTKTHFCKVCDEVTVHKVVVGVDVEMEKKSGGEHE